MRIGLFAFDERQKESDVANMGPVQTPAKMNGAKTVYESRSTVSLS